MSLISLIFKRKPIPDYQADLPWKYPDRPVLKSWYRWAIPYNLLHIQVAYSFFVLVALVFGAIMYSTFLGQGKPKFQWNALFTAILSASIFLAAFTPMVFEHKIYVYRCTAEGLEVCSWKEGYKKAIFVIKVAAVLQEYFY